MHPPPPCLHRKKIFLETFFCADGEKNFVETLFAPPLCSQPFLHPYPPPLYFDPYTPMRITIYRQPTDQNLCKWKIQTFVGNDIK